MDVNRQKDALKKNGIFVDGKTYTVKFKGKPFHFRRCGWPQNKELIWLLNDKK